jgi:hypothetical protein
VHYTAGHPCEVEVEERPPIGEEATTQAAVRAGEVQSALRPAVVAAETQPPTLFVACLHRLRAPARVGDLRAVGPDPVDLRAHSRCRSSGSAATHPDVEFAVGADDAGHYSFTATSPRSRSTLRGEHRFGYYLEGVGSDVPSGLYVCVVERRRAVALARHYREVEGLSITEIARRLGRAPTTIKAYFYDPTGAKARAVKARYVGVCRGCGTYTQPRNGKGDAYAYCKVCHPGAIERRWTCERVLEAMAEWLDRYGRLPSSYDWSATHARRRGGEALRRLRGGEWPPASVVTDVFGSWAQARASAEAVGTMREGERKVAHLGPGDGEGLVGPGTRNDAGFAPNSADQESVAGEHDSAGRAVGV